jgi:hypothetical protein
MIMDYLHLIYKYILENPILAGLVTVGLTSSTKFFFIKIKILLSPSNIEGYWITKFSSKGIKEKQNIEVFNFKRKKISDNNQENFHFVYQHFNNIFCKSKPHRGHGYGSLKNNHFAGIYFVKSSDFRIGSIMLRLDSSFKAKYCKRLIGTYTEFVDNNILPTCDDDYIFYKVDLSLKNRLFFRLGIKCFKNYTDALSFYDNHIKKISDFDQIICRDILRVDNE